ncbi:hypothetical protein SELMODRAFT_425306 [Selaginella moellendorffii]|uniref:B box-type domain-containing protein n=1 Tax=Selaginella moellendorffii TaxID=88036 RepID=D8SSP2_SELML|nr:uncharacterized protein LOC9649422 [Selaginella moellendorffii]XP_002988744.1 uncharacterized protein LOC9639315 [Selaginella moellendorffii]EFJ10255.1 hypothetical protein SELMODRAFT_427354 [Selaginella moellendorffii]EFJ12517.1 hypothetical protein SELMODRAFT_425306 [Selaginella moellendorffii]|eukprot:XP_002986308.1 uncharacterized protein LOC9649422 [Selaginella moellendorffii]
MVGYALESAPRKPVWLEALLSEKFFGCCSTHATVKKNERNIFCVDCNGSICQHCLSSHSGHRLVQVRRYVYHDVIRLHDMQKLVDCSQVQTYIINSARVVFLNQRPQPRPSKGLSNSCDTCERSLQESYRYCSIACKVDAVGNNQVELDSLVPRRVASSSSTDGGFSSSPEDETLKVDKLELDDELSPNSDDCQSQASSGCSGNKNEAQCDDHIVTSVMMIPPPKRIRSNRYPGQCSPKSVIIPHCSSRRKSTPHRSPIF